MIETVIFDAEGVVIDTERLWDDAQRELLARRGLAYDRERLKPLLSGRSVLEGAEVLRDMHALEESPEAIAEERRQIMAGLLDAGIELVEGFAELHDAIRTRCHTCLATAMDPELFGRADAALSLSERFDAMVTLADVGVGKPAPDLFLEAARRVASPPERCLVVEDAPLGIAAARAAGMRCVAVATTYLPARLSEADVVYRSVAAIDPGSLFAVRGQDGHLDW